MIEQDHYEVEPWSLRESSLELDLLAQSESVFALANGHVGLRGNLDEGEPHGIPGTYLNAFYEVHPLPYAEAGYGYPEAGQTVVNVTNGKLIRLLVDDEPFDVRYGTLRDHERILDFRAGVLRRRVDWVSPAGQRVRVSSVRMVSFVQRAVAAIAYEVEPLDDPARLVIQSELVPNEPLPTVADDPRAAAAVTSPLRPEQCSQRAARVVLVHSTVGSGLRMAAGMDHVSDGPPGTEVSEAEADPDLGRVTATAEVEPGQRLRLVKFLAYGWSAQRSLPAVRDQVEAALTAARHTGWEGLLAEQREYLDDFWTRADVELEGDAELQQAIRFGMFHTLQAGARAENRAIPAKGLTGPGYDGHTFWDTETFVLPLLTYTVSGAARDALRWRHSTLDHARDRAKQLGLRGAAFPWRTIHGEECSGYWPAGTAAFHIGADIADAVVRYEAATADTAFAAREGLELLVETARLWRSLGHHDDHGRFRIDGVTGPDEYSALADNNVYTNLMAERNLRCAAEAVERHPDRAAQLGVDPEEAAGWRDAAQAILIPYDEARGVPAVPALPLLRSLPQAGGQAGRPGAGSAAARRRLQRGGEDARLRLLRGADSPRLVVVGVHPIRHGGRGRPPPVGLRLLRRGGAHGPRGPRAQHQRRTAHRLAGGRLDRCRGRLRRCPRPRRLAQLHTAAARAANPSRLWPVLPGDPAQGRGGPAPSALLAPARRDGRSCPLRRGADRLAG